MTRKTTSYARRIARHGKREHISAVAQTLMRVLPYNEALEFAGLRIEASPRALHMKTKTRESLERLRVGTAGVKDFDDLAHDLAVAGFRRPSIKGGADEKETLWLIFVDANKAIDSCRRRYLKWHKFELLDAEYADLVAGVDAYEIIFDASSPAQMQEAEDAYFRWVQMNRKKAA
jgi:hypothetical protein